MRSRQLRALFACSALAVLACGSNSSSDSTDGISGAGNIPAGAGGTVAVNPGASGSADLSAGATNGGDPSGGAMTGGASSGGASSGGTSSSGAYSGGANTGASAGRGGASGGANTGASAGHGGASGGADTGASAGRGGASGGANTGASAGRGGASGGGSGVVFPANCTCLELGPPACSASGHVSYALAKAAAPTADQLSAYEAITCAMDGAVAYYNCNTTITKQLNVSYDPSVPTADGNINGSVRFGGRAYMECATGMHEIAHAVGVGTAPRWSTYSVGGLFTGATAIAQLRAITGNASEVLHSDTQHFWPYGLNFASEAGSTADLIDHCLMVTAIRKDLGLQ